MNNIIHYIEDFTNPVVDKKFSIGELFFLKYIDNSKVDNYYYPNSICIFVNTFFPLYYNYIYSFSITYLHTVFNILQLL